MRRVAAVIVTYERKDKLRSCIEAVLGQDSDVQPELFIVDNNSGDGTVDMVRRMMADNSGEGLSGLRAGSRIRYFNTGHNAGGAGGFCYGIRKAVEAGATHLWLMDDDCVPSENALAEFLKFDDEHSGEYGFLSSKTLWTDGSLCRMNIQKESLTREVVLSGDDPASAVMASFVSLFIPADVVREVGLPFKEFFIWTDDWEYTRRISLRYPCYVLPSSVVVHDTAENTGADISSVSDDRLWRFRYLYRNDVVLYRREGLKGLAYEAARLPVHMLRVARSGLSVRDKLKRTGIIIKGTAEGLRFHPVPDRAGPSSWEE